MCAFFFFAYYKQVRDLLHFSLANFFAKRFIATINFHANIAFLEFLFHFFCVIKYFVVDSENSCLHRGKPKGKRPVKMFQEYADKSFKRTKHGAMNYPWHLFFTVFINVRKIKLFGEHYKIKLRGAHLPIAALGIFHVYFNFGTVKRAFTFVYSVSCMLFFERFFKCVFRHVPNFFGAKGFLGSGSEHIARFKTKRTIEFFYYLYDRGYFFFHLVGTYEYVRVVHGNLPYTEQTMDDAHIFVAI